MALSAQNQSTSYVNLYYSIVQRAATRYFKEYYNSGEYPQFSITTHGNTHNTRVSLKEHAARIRGDDGRFRRRTRMTRTSLSRFVLP